MTIMILSLALCLGTVLVLRDAVTTQGLVQPAGLGRARMLAAFAITALVALVTSPFHAIGFVLAALLYETSAALACRAVGHDVVRLRLIPLPDAHPRTEASSRRMIEEAYVALFPAAVAAGPMVLAFALHHLLAGSAPVAADFARAVGLMLGAVNFVLLLPFAPFAGGRVVAALADSFAPAFSPVLTVFMTAAVGAAAIRDGSIALFVLTAVGLASLLPRAANRQTPLSVNEALPVMACYAFCLGAHYLGGWWLLTRLV